MLLPFQPIVLHAVGLSDPSIAWILISPGLAAIVSPAFVAYVADRHLSASAVLGLLLLSSGLAAGMFLLADGPLSWFLCTFLVNCLFIPTTNLTDTAVLKLLRDGELPGLSVEHFPRLRVWGSLGFMVPGFLMLLLPSTAKVSVALLVGAFSSTAILAAMVSLALPRVPVEGGREKLPTKEALAFVFRSPLFHLVGPLFLVAMALSLLYVLLPRYGEELGLTAAEIGSFTNVGVLVELIVLPWVGSKTAQRIGALGLAILGVGALAVRLVVLSSTGTIELVVATQTLHAFTVAALFIVTPMLLQSRVDPSFRYSLQGIYVVLTVGVARTLGPALAGVVLTLTGLSGQEGCRAVFLFGSALALIALFWLTTVTRKRLAEPSSMNA